MGLSLEYIAGIFDGEGCVSTNGARGYLFVHIACSNDTVLTGVSELFGGCISTRANGNKTWTATTQSAKRFLVAILPYLIIKRQVAEVGIALASRPKESPLHPEREVLRRRMHELNLMTSPRAARKGRFEVEAK